MATTNYTPDAGNETCTIPSVIAGMDGTTLTNTPVPVFGIFQIQSGKHTTSGFPCMNFVSTDGKVCATWVLKYTETRDKQIISCNNFYASLSAIPQIQTDWDEADNTNPSFIKNKPTIPAAQQQTDWNASSGITAIAHKPTIPAAQIQSDWNQANNSLPDFIKNKPTIPNPQKPNIIIYAAGAVVSYNPTAGISYIIVEMVGGGGDGCGGGLAGSGGSGFTGGSSAMVGTGVNLQASAGAKATSSTPGTGGIANSTTVPAGALIICNTQGGNGQWGLRGSIGSCTGGNGGSSFFGEGGMGGAFNGAGTRAQGAGSGGGGGGVTGCTLPADTAGHGGGGGNYMKVYFPVSVLSGSYTVTAGSDSNPTGGAAGTNGFAGGGGRGGRVVITEFFI